jgi:hypothetical protein
MADKPQGTDDNEKKIAVSATDLNKVIPKLATKVLLGKVGTNTVLTFVVDLGDGTLQVIESIAVDSSLHGNLIQLLKNDLKKQEDKK